jgi:hypothetical protein
MRKHYTTRIGLAFICCGFATSGLAVAKDANDAIEPAFQGPGVIDLMAGGTLEAWKVPSDRWSVEKGVVVGDTGAEKLRRPEWLYTKQRFGDFAFTCELKLTGDHSPNSGIYYRVSTFRFENLRNSEPFEAASGYEFDAVNGKFCGSLGDWYARPSLRVFPDPEVIKLVFRENEWNRMTIRARGNRMEYWINGIKIMDYLDNDPKGSREGVIGVQIHDGALMKVECRNLRAVLLEPKNE